MVNKITSSQSTTDKWSTKCWTNAGVSQQSSGQDICRAKLQTSLYDNHYPKSWLGNSLQNLSANWRVYRWCPKWHEVLYHPTDWIISGRVPLITAHKVSASKTKAERERETDRQTQRERERERERSPVVLSFIDIISSTILFMTQIQSVL